MSAKRLFSVVILSLCLCDIVRAKKDKGTYVVNYASGVKTCEDETSKNFFTIDLDPKRINETFSKLEGSFENFYEYDGHQKIEFVVEKLNPSGSKEVVITHTMNNVCGKLQRRESDVIYGQYLKNMNVPDCPIPAGVYQISDMRIDTSTIPVGPSFKGKYLVTMTFIKKNQISVGLVNESEQEFLGCAYFEYAIENVN